MMTVITQKKNPFLVGQAFYFSLPLAVEKMNIAAELLLTLSDFTSFAKLHSDNKTNLCKVLKAEWTEDNDTLVFTITANRFLRNMVRAVVGTLMDIGLGRYEPAEILEIAKAGNRNNAGSSVPAEGLFLHTIVYPEHIFRRNASK